VYVDVNVQVLKLAFSGFDSFDKHRLEDVAGTAPGGTSLNQDWSFTVVDSGLPVEVRFHLLDVIRLLLAWSLSSLIVGSEPHSWLHKEG